MKNKSFENKYNGLTAEQLLNSGRLLDEVATAFCLDCSVGFLQRDRHINGTDPEVPYIKRGRSVRYEPDVIKQVLENSRIGQVKIA